MAVDLYITNVSLGSSVLSSGESFDIDWTVVNGGSSSAATTYSEIYLYNSNFSQSWYLGRQSAGTSGPNSTDSETDTFSIPDGIAKGSYFIGVFADYDLRVSESKGFKNLTTVPVTISTAPQNTSYSLTRSPSTAMEGDQVTFTVTRSGDRPAETIRRLWIS